MTRLVLQLVAALSLQGQSVMVKHGAEIFQSTCANAYCHGAQGKAGRAPALGGRMWQHDTLFHVINDGRPDKGMPTFSRQLKPEDLEAVTRYVMSLGPSGGHEEPDYGTGKEMPPEVSKGRAFFFDAVRMGGCGRCHELDDRGVGVGPDLHAVNTSTLENLRAVPSKHVITVKPNDEEAFPALLVEQTPERTQVYDLTAALPVLRTFRPSQVRITPGSAWSHAAAVAGYSDVELQAIGRYLRREGKR